MDHTCVGAVGTLLMMAVWRGGGKEDCWSTRSGKSWEGAVFVSAGRGRQGEKELERDGVGEVRSMSLRLVRTKRRLSLTPRHAFPLAGFTSMSKQVQPELVMAFLNQ